MDIYDILEDLGSYLNDMEQCLQMDPETWEDYQSDPVPYITDLLCDFGQFPDGVDIEEVAENAARKYMGR